MTHDALLAYYATPGVFTNVTGFEEQFDLVADDVTAVAGIVQGLLIHQALAPLYHVALTPERAAERELHGTDAILACATRLDGRPLCQPRAPDHRVVGVCRHFATMFVALLRHKGIPSRVRCGFANYFEAGKHTEHWVGEYWKSEDDRWVLVDAQVDELQRALFRPDFDTLDVPRDRFLVAGDAWRACQSGVDPMSFGVAGTQNWGLLEVYGELFQDLAALQKIELLPWGWYGLAKDKRALETETGLVDQLARLSTAADAPALEALQAALARDERLRVPADTVAGIVTADRAAVGFPT